MIEKRGRPEKDRRVREIVQDCVDSGSTEILPITRAHLESDTEKKRGVNLIGVD